MLPDEGEMIRSLHLAPYLEVSSPDGAIAKHRSSLLQIRDGPPDGGVGLLAADGIADTVASASEAAAAAAGATR
eukprot:CAMPEP_0178625822 /NCGR_PEP_ID=MMETSP0698-20121128/8081_1 /TAXON_ID=265572 /ORGANISM="Extubocellulus spinifer, Strain CCMP396" /LENGTH=73 /DNA_ID=CAMNT_0020265007 /DNA_START=80 /DNA_END=298 /DNA_ORIENTATION=-